MNEQKLDELTETIDRYGQQLFRFAFFRTGSTEEAQDIVQDIFLRMYDRPTGTVENIKSYLYRAIANRCANYRRSRHTRKNVPLTEAAMKPEPEKEDFTAEYNRIETLMKTLPDQQAEVIRLRTVDALPFGEIAELLGIPLTTAKSRFRYGIEKIKNRMQYDLR